MFIVLAVVLVIIIKLIGCSNKVGDEMFQIEVLISSWRKNIWKLVVIYERNFNLKHI